MGDKIVGHKTLVDDQGNRRHEPLYQSEADELEAHIAAEEAKREALMPTEQDAINMLWAAQQRLKELGWNDARYCPKDGSEFQVIESGSTGVFNCRYRGEWPTGSYDVYAHGDVWPGRPMLFKRGTE